MKWRKSLSAPHTRSLLAECITTNQTRRIRGIALRGYYSLCSPPRSQRTLRYMRVAFLTYRHRSFITLFAEKGMPVFLLCALCVLFGEISAQDFKQIHPGVEYAQVAQKIGTDPVKINLLRIDRMKVRLDVVHAGAAVIGLETTSSIAKRRGAVAAINAGFFRLDKSAFAGDAAGVLMIDRMLLSESISDRTAIFITDYPSTNLGIGQVRTEHNLESNGRRFPVHGINRERKADEIVVYQEEFGPTTLTATGGVEITVLQGKVTSVNMASGNGPIPKGGYVISASGKFTAELAAIRMGDPAGFYRLAFLLRDGLRLPLEMVDDVVAGVPQLIKNGKIDITWEQEKAAKSFAETRHPRTAVARLESGKFLFATVDGRQPGVSVGMSLQELADYLLSLGAVNAMNLDGGGSTTMFLDGKVVNTPSDPTGERKIGDAILVTLRKNTTKK